MSDMADPQANVEVVKRFLTLIQGGLQGVLPHLDELIHPEIEWNPVVLTMGQETYNGIDELKDYLREAGTMSDGEMTIQEVATVGDDWVMALTWIDFRGKSESFYSEYAVLYRMEDGLIRVMRAFLSHAAAKEAARELTGSPAEGSPNA